MKGVFSLIKVRDNFGLSTFSARVMNKIHLRECTTGIIERGCGQDDKTGGIS